MDGFLKDFEKMVDDKTLADNIELPASSEFEGKDTFVNMYMSEFDGVSGYTYKKSEGSYNTESRSMIYMLMINGCKDDT